MRYSIFLKKNNQEIREKISSNGFSLCKCCEFENSIWLHYSFETESFHGAGYGCECECKDRTPEKCVVCHLDESKDKRNILLFNDVDDMLNIVNYLKKC